MFHVNLFTCAVPGIIGAFQIKSELFKTIFICLFFLGKLVINIWRQNHITFNTIITSRWAWLFLVVYALRPPVIWENKLWQIQVLKEKQHQMIKDFVEWPSPRKFIWKVYKLLACEWSCLLLNPQGCIEGEASASQQQAIPYWWYKSVFYHW